MKTSATSRMLGLLACKAWAGPIRAIQQRQFIEAAITFIAVDPSDTYSMSIPTIDEPVKINSPLSVSKISSAGGAICSFSGVDGSSTLVVGEQTVDVGPPQAQVECTCQSL